MTSPDGRSAGPRWWPGGITDRQRVLLHVEPLFAQRLNDSVQPERLRHYDSLALSLRIVELVLEASGLDDPIDRDKVVDELGPTMAAMDRAKGMAPDAARHAKVVDRLLGTLRNDADGRRPFQLPYTAIEPDGTAETRLLQFRLLVDAFHPDGRVVLQATTEGANLYLRALGQDLESQQAATEAIIELQLRRGRFQDAVEGARQAEQASVRYHAQLMEVLSQTLRDLRQVDWQRTVPTLLDDAHIHLMSRLEVEDRLLAAADARLEQLAQGSDAALEVGRTRRLLEGCRRRHQELHALVMGARQQFLAQQVRQTFVPRVAVPRPDLAEEVLAPMLSATVKNVLPLCDLALTVLCPPVPPGIPWLADMLEWELQRPRGLETPKDDDVSRDLVDVLDETRRFPAELQARGEELLRCLDQPTRLSDLLATPQVAADGPVLREYLVLRALQAVAPELPGAEGASRATRRVPLLAERLGTFDHPEFIGDNITLQVDRAAASRAGRSRTPDQSVQSVIADRGTA